MPGIEHLSDLSGRTVQVVRDSSHAEHLRRVNGELKATRRKPIVIAEVSPFVTSEDLLELVNAGAVAITVADDFRAALWAKVLPDIRVLEDVVINEAGSTGWAVREGNPDLRDNLAAFAKTIRKGTLLGNTLHKRYYEQTKWPANPLADSERKKFEAVVELFKKYGTQYAFDYLAIIAQAYQESKLDQSVAAYARQRRRELESML